jgi:hypothetical protein
MKRLKRFCFDLAASFVLNFILLGIIFCLIVFDVGGVWFWRLFSLFLLYELLLLDANLYWRGPVSRIINMDSKKEIRKKARKNG